MNKKLMTLAVAGAFVAPAAALAQASNVQIYGTMYIEYAYGKQGAGPGAAGFLSQNPLNNTDLLQTPGSAIGFKGEEALGGGLTAWFQCESTAEIRGGGTQTAGVVAGAQNSGIFCGRNSAAGVKGNFGNIFAGNWDAPMKAYNTSIMGTNETGVWGTSFLLYGSSTSLNDASGPTVFERRQNNSISYISPTWSGFSARALVSTPQTTIGLSSNATVGKPRVLGLGVNYTNGPLIVLGSWEQHTNFATLNGAASQKGTTDNGYQIGASYQFGPVKAGAIYIKRNFDSGCIGLAGCSAGDASIGTYGINLDWTIAGPHELKAAYVHANSTTGGFGANPTTGTTVGNLVFNQGAGNTGGTLWELEYIYNLSKRTRVSGGYVSQTNDSNAKYGLGGFTAPAAGQSQNAFAVSMKHTF
jgi:predicted porin